MKVFSFYTHSTMTKIVALSSLFIFAIYFLFCSDGHDAVIRIHWHEQFNALFWKGVLYPHWLPGSFEGFGSPTFYFYPPLVYWIGAIVNPFSTFSPQFSQGFIAVVGAILSVLSMGFYLRQYSDNRVKVLVLSLLYAIHPYRIVDVVTRSALSEHFAFIFIPLLFLSIDLATKKERRSYSLSYSLSTFSWFLLILTNIPTVIMTGAACFIYLIVKREILSWKGFLPFLGGGITSLLLASFYLFPAALLQKEILLGHLFNMAERFHRSNYLLVDIFSGNYKYALGLLLVLLLSCIQYVPFFLRRDGASFTEESSRIALLRSAWKWIAILSLTFQIPYLFSAIAGFVPFLDLVQFSWRWLSLLVPFTSIALLLNWREQNRKTIHIHVAVTISLSFFLIAISLYNFYVIRPSKNLYPVFTEAPEYMNTFVDLDPEKAYNVFRAHAKDPLIMSERALDSGSGEKIHISNPQPNVYQMQSILLRETKVTFHQQYFPLWNLQSSQGALILSPDSIGRITTTLPMGTQEAKLSLSNPPLHSMSIVFSFTGLCAFLFVIFTLRKKRAS